MTQSDSERFADLEWMLSSSQEDERALIKFLIHDQYAQVVHLCRKLVNNPVYARQAAAQTLAAAVVRADRYAGHSSAPAWIYRLAVEVCYDQYGLLLPLAAATQVLHRDLDLSIGDTAYVLKASEKQVEVALKELGESRDGGETAGRLENQPEADGLPLQGWEAIDPDQVQDEVLRLVQSSRHRRRFSARLQEAVLVGLGLVVAVLLGRAAFAGLPAPASPATPTRPEAITTQEVLVYREGQSQPGGIAERRIMYPAEAGDTLTSIAVKTGIRLDRLQELNQIPPVKPLQPGQPVVIAIWTPVLSLITPTPVTPVSPPEPLSMHSDPDPIRRRILDSQHNWNTLWAEAVTIRYGPPGYIGPPKIDYQQIWISQPGYSLTLSGRPDGQVEIAIQASGGLVTTVDNRSGERTLLNRSILVNYTQPIHELLLPTRMRTNFNEILEVVGEEMVAGRPALILEWFEVGEPGAKSPATEQLLHMGRFWVDEVTGVILRRQRFDPGQPGLIFEEVVVTQIRYDLPLSNRFFDPSQPLPTRLSYYFSGNPLEEGFNIQTFEPATQSEREPFVKQLPPADLDPARSILLFQWTSLAGLEPSRPTRADVFADGYFLGNVEFGDPRSLSCLRSLDGKMIAFTEWLEEPPFGARPLRWFSLEDLQTVYEPMPELISGNFAFAPDSRRLALFACTRSLQDCGIHILDLASSKSRQIVKMAYAGLLAWSPDGKQLAFRGARKPRELASLWVVDVRSGQVTYNGPLDPESGQPDADSPLRAWGVTWQATARGVESCSRPPED